MVTLLWYRFWEDSTPLGVFESNAKAVEYIRQTYGNWPGLEDVSEEDGEFCCDPPSPARGSLVIQRFAMNTAIVERSFLKNSNDDPAGTKETI